MRIRTNAERGARFLTSGSVLLVSMVVISIVGVTLASYLILVSSQNKFVGRSQSWNTAIPVAEAGVEEALTQLYYGGTNHLGTNGWALGTDGMYHKTQTLSADSGYYATAIQPAASPVIWSTGYVAAPVSAAGTSVGRLLRVVATKVQSFGGGISAKGKITLSGGASLDAYATTNGVYNTGAPIATATALTDSSVAGAISLSGGHVAGNVSTGPGGTVTTSGSAVVGDMAYIQSGGSGSPNVESGHWTTDANYQFNDVAVPSFSSYSTSFASVGTTNYAGSAGTSSYYVVPSIGSSSSTKPLIVNGQTTIYCTQTGNYAVNVSGSGYIQIMPGASLTLYLAGNFSNSGGGIVNGNGLASACTIYGLPTCTTVTYSGGSSFIGVVDAPEADFTFSGSEKAIGAFVVNTATISGSGGVHWDPNIGGNPGYVVISWNEMPMH